jgi:hypothetical protein
MLAAWQYQRPLCADIVAKIFLGDERNFLGPLMRFVCGDVMDLHHLLLAGLPAHSGLPR